MGKSVMMHQFSQVPRSDIPRSSFNRSHAYKTTFDAGYLIPYYVDEVLPGDVFNVNSTMLMRFLSPLVNPIIDNLFLDTFCFFVPNRLLWDNWKAFMGEKVNPDDTTEYVVPRVLFPSAGFAVGSLFDYLGVPTDQGYAVSPLGICSFYSRAYNLIWNTWFRDQNIQDPVVVDTGDGDDDSADYVLLRRGKRHDYFTSCLPWPQKGDAVQLPLGSEAPVIGIGKYNTTFGLGSTTAYESNGDTAVYDDAIGIDTSNVNNVFYVEKQTIGETAYPHIRADLSNATAATINTLRLVFQVQRMLERDARGGTRYPEILMSHFGVVDVSHAVLQRPQYLGGGSTPVLINPVNQTSVTSGTSGLGKLAAFGMSVSHKNGFTKAFTEHGVIICLLSVRADLTYQQGLNRLFAKTDRYDYYFPALAHLGEQCVFNYEIFVSGDVIEDMKPFGYQEAWAHYRYYPSKITGKLRSTATIPLDVWHLSQEFADTPVLSDEFIQDTPPIDRVIAVPSENDFIIDIYNDVKTARCMPVYSVPGLIDHF